MVIIRQIQDSDNETMADIIREVMPEFGANGAGFALHDAEVFDLFGAYTKDRCSYFVCEYRGAIVGGGGIAPLQDGDLTVCELKKMYFVKEVRGLGFGQLMLSKCIEAARNHGYKICYLETFHTMKGAMKLYEKNGFQTISAPLGNTGHFACDKFYTLKL